LLVLLLVLLALKLVAVLLLLLLTTFFQLFLLLVLLLLLLLSFCTSWCWGLAVGVITQGAWQLPQLVGAQVHTYASGAVQELGPHD
jgi:hypothetical protein